MDIVKRMSPFFHPNTGQPFLIKDIRRVRTSDFNQRTFFNPSGLILPFTYYTTGRYRIQRSVSLLTLNDYLDSENYAWADKTPEGFNVGDRVKAILRGPIRLIDDLLARNLVSITKDTQRKPEYQYLT